MTDRKKDAKALTPLLQVGKNGLTENFIDELDSAFIKRALVKIKLLPSCDVEPVVAAETINKALHTTTVDIVGRTITFYRK